MTTDRTELRRLAEAATPGPWQQSRFVDGPMFARMGPAWKATRTAEESTMVRGAGIVGDPRCNPVGAIRSDEDRALALAAVNALPALLDELDALRAVRDAAAGYLASLAGQGHPTDPHDRVLHEVGKHGLLCAGTPDEDCSACAGQQYGSEDALRAALEAAR
jgi:hypothetical protein